MDDIEAQTAGPAPDDDERYWREREIAALGGYYPDSGSGGGGGFVRVPQSDAVIVGE